MRHAVGLCVLLVACARPTSRAPRREPAQQRAPGKPAQPTTPLATEPAWTAAPQPGPTTAPVAVASAKPERCSIRITERGLMVDGDFMKLEHAIALCKQRSAALVDLADGADEDQWNKLRAGLRRAHVRVMLRGAPGPGECIENPLAKGCN